MSFRLSREVEELVWADGPNMIIAVPGGWLIHHRGSGRHMVLEHDGAFWLGWYEQPEVPVFKWRATDRVALERLLLMRIGEGHRIRREMNAIGLPYHPDMVKPGYSVVPGSQNGWHSLRRQDGSTVPFEARDTGGVPSFTAIYSYVADMPLKHIAASYREPGGNPLFGRYLWKELTPWSLLIGRGEELKTPSEMKTWRSLVRTGRGEFDLKWPPDAAVPDSRVTTDAARYVTENGPYLDRIGAEDGTWFARVIDGRYAPSFQARSLSAENIDKPYWSLEFNVDRLKGLNVASSTAAPWFGYPGGATQLQVLDTAGHAMSLLRMLKAGIVRVRP